MLAPCVLARYAETGLVVFQRVLRVGGSNMSNSYVANDE